MQQTGSDALQKDRLSTRKSYRVCIYCLTTSEAYIQVRFQCGSTKDEKAMVVWPRMTSMIEGTFPTRERGG